MVTKPSDIRGTDTLELRGVRCPLFALLFQFLPLNPTPDSQHPTPYTRHPAPYTPNSKFSTRSLKPHTLNPKHRVRGGRGRAANRQQLALAPGARCIAESVKRTPRVNLEPSTLNRKPYAPGARGREGGRSAGTEETLTHTLQPLAWHWSHLLGRLFNREGKCLLSLARTDKRVSYTLVACTIHGAPRACAPLARTLSPLLERGSSNVPLKPERSSRQP